MLDIKSFHPQFITNEAGEHTAVVLSIPEYQELLEDIEDLAAIAERHAETVLTHEDLLAELRNAEIL